MRSAQAIPTSPQKRVLLAQSLRKQEALSVYSAANNLESMKMSYKLALTP